eukprot:2215421-Amphidinium_carterae.2
MDGCKPAYVRVCGYWPGTGAELKFLLTGTIFSDGALFWHADQLLQHLSGNEKLRVGRWFSREGAGFMQQIGGKLGGHFCRSHQASSKTPLDTERTTQEFSLSTEALIRLCLWWAAGRATKASKQRARPFLQFLLSALLQPGDCTTLPLRLPAPVTDMCTHQSQAGICLHVQTIAHDIAGSSSTPMDLQTSLFFSYMHFDCVACHTATGSEIKRIAALVHARALSGGYASDVGLAVSAYVERGVKRRIDAHVRAGILAGEMRKRQRTRIGMEVVHGLQHFFPKRALRALDSRRKRFPLLRQDASDGHLWPEGQRLRWHVAEKGVQEAFPELPAEVRCLHVVTDQGTVGWTLHFYLLYAGCGLTWSLDPHHRLVNDVRSAIAAAGLQIHQCTATAVLNLQSGPWQSSRYATELKQVCTEYMRCETWEGQLFQLHFDVLAGLVPSSQPGSEEHMQAVWARVCEILGQLSMGARTARSRWFHFFETAEQFMPCWYPLLLVLTWYGIQRGYFKDLTDLPIQKERQAVDALGDGVPADVVDEQVVPGKEAKSERALPGVSAGGQMMAATWALADRTLHDACSTMVCLVGPLRKWHLDLVCNHRSPDGCMEYLRDASCGSWYSKLHDLWGVLSDETSLQCMGFATQPMEMIAARVDSSHACIMAEMCFSACHELVGVCLARHLTHTQSLPGILPALLSDDITIVNKTLQVLSTWFEVLIAVERVMVRDTFLKTWHRDLGWPVSCWLRWILFRLSEFGFTSVPPEIRKAILEYSRALLNTQQIEDCFSDMRRQEKKSPNSQIGRQSRWSTCVNHVMEMDRSGRGRAMLVPTESKQNQRKALPATLFQADAMTCTLENGILRDMMHGTDQWFSPGPATYLNLSCMWMSTVEFKDRLDCLPRVWLSLLAINGCMLKHKSTNRGGLVVHVSPYGVLVWNMSVKTTATELFWEYVQPKTKRPWGFHVVTALDEWECLSCTALPPELSSTRAPSGMRDGPFISVCRNGRRTPLLQYSAARGFPNLTKQRLEDLYALLDCKRTPRPSTLADYLNAVVAQVLPDLSVDEVSKVVQKRLGGEKSRAQPAPLHPEEASAYNSAAFDELLDEEDASILRAALAKRRAAGKTSDTAQRSTVVKDTGVHADVPHSTAASSTHRGPLPETRRAYVHDLESLPAEGPSRLYRETNYHTRYRACYGSTLKTKCWGTRYSERDAALFVLRWLWAQHHASTGVECPFDLDASVLETPIDIKGVP